MKLRTRATCRGWNVGCLTSADNSTVARQCTGFIGQTNTPTPITDCPLRCHLTENVPKKRHGPTGRTLQTSDTEAGLEHSKQATQNTPETRHGERSKKATRSEERRGGNRR